MSQFRILNLEFRTCLEFGASDLVFATEGSLRG